MGNFWKNLERDVDMMFPDTSNLFQHNAYRRHFEGYVEKREATIDGKEKVRRVYKGEYYRQNLSRLQYVLLRVGYLAGMAAGIVLFVKGAVCERESNYAALVVFAQSITGLLILYSAFVLLIYLMTPRKMTIGDYKSGSIAFCKALKRIGISVLAVIALTVGYDLLFMRRIGLEDLYCILCFALCGLIFIGMRSLEEHIEYQTVS